MDSALLSRWEPSAAQRLSAIFESNGLRRIPDSPFGMVDGRQDFRGLPFSNDRGGCSIAGGDFSGAQYRELGLFSNTRFVRSRDLDVGALLSARNRISEDPVITPE